MSGEKYSPGCCRKFEFKTTIHRYRPTEGSDQNSRTSLRFRSRTKFKYRKRDLRIYGQGKIRIEQEFVCFARPLHRVTWPKHTQNVNRANPKITTKFPKVRLNAIRWSFSYGRWYTHVRMHTSIFSLLMHTYTHATHIHAT
jgi:hypothetical protein